MRRFLKYHIYDRWILWKQSRQLANSNEDPVLIFTMAKVGSLSVYHSLEKYGRAPVFHIHSLDRDAERKHISFCLKNGTYPGSRTPVFLLCDEVVKKNRPFKVITLFRNPIERNLSAFFEAFELKVGVKPTEYKGSLDELEQIFHQTIDHDYAFQWYEKQFLEGTGIDVYKHPFDAQQGHGVISEGKVEVLLLNSTLGNAQKEQQIRNFCGLKEFQIKDVNVTSASRSAPLYRDFLEHIRFSEEYLNRQLYSPYVQHFFTQEERDKIFQKWVRN